MLGKFQLRSEPLANLESAKLLIQTVNAHSYNLTQQDTLFKESLSNSEVLLPDGISVVWAYKLLTGNKVKKIAGADLFHYEMERLQKIKGSCFFLGSSESTLTQIKERTAQAYPNVRVHTFSPPFKEEFSKVDNNAMVHAINAVQPEVLFVGMTAPKQEKWAYQHFEQLQVGHVCCIGAVFDFYAGTVQRAPLWMIKLGLEWFFRLVSEPKRMWRRYLIGNTLFVYYIFLEWVQMKLKVKR